MTDSELKYFITSHAETPSAGTDFMDKLDAKLETADVLKQYQRQTNRWYQFACVFALVIGMLLGALGVLFLEFLPEMSALFHLPEAFLLFCMNNRLVLTPSWIVLSVLLASLPLIYTTPTLYLRGVSTIKNGQ